jgi:hypothetical protein
MRIRVPDVYRAYPTGYHTDLLPWGWESTTPPGWMNMLSHNMDGSLEGLRRGPALGHYGRTRLGQCDFEGDPTCEDGSGGGTINLPPINVGPITYPTIDPTTLQLPGYSCDSSGNCVSTSGGALPPGSVLTGSGGTPVTTTLAQLLQASATAASTAAAINKSIQTPSLIPGTSLVYNPATGQISNALGLTGTQIAASGLAGLGGIGMIAVLGVVLLLVMKK